MSQALAGKTDVHGQTGTRATHTEKGDQQMTGWLVYIHWPGKVKELAPEQKRRTSWCVPGRKLETLVAR